MRACLHHCITKKILVRTTTTSDAKGMDETDSWLPLLKVLTPDPGMHENNF